MISQRTPHHGNPGAFAVVSGDMHLFWVAAATFAVAGCGRPLPRESSKPSPGRLEPTAVMADSPESPSCETRVVRSIMPDDGAPLPIGFVAVGDRVAGMRALRPGVVVYRLGNARGMACEAWHLGVDWMRHVAIVGGEPLSQMFDLVRYDDELALTPRPTPGENRGTMRCGERYEIVDRVARGVVVVRGTGNPGRLLGYHPADAETWFFDRRTCTAAAASGRARPRTCDE